MRPSLKTAVAMLTAAVLLEGCAVVPFIPTMVHALPRIITSGRRPSQASPAVVADPPAPADPVIAAVVTGRSESPPGPFSADSAAPTTVAQQSPARLKSPDDGGIIPIERHIDLVSDLKAHAVGDLLTVIVSESFNGQTAAQTELNNKRSINAGLPNLFTATESLALHNPLLDLNNIVNGSSENKSTGKGSMTATDTFTATVSAVVVAVNPAGTLTIRGERRIRVNGQNDTLRLSGIVRPEDIDSDNTIPSRQVADLQLSLTGVGLVRDKQGGGLGGRLMDWLWLF